MSRMSLSVLSEAEIARMHEKTLEVFEDVGVVVAHAEALDKLKRAGAKVEETSGKVRFPAKMVDELIAMAPATVLATGLNGKQLEMGGEQRHYLSLILDPFIIDRAAGPRKPLLEDVRRHTILGESLPRIDAMMRMQCPVADVPEPDCYHKTKEVFLCHATKHIAAMPASQEDLQDWIGVMEVIADAAGLDAAATPLMTLAVAITSPLQIHATNVEILKSAVSRCYPLTPTVCPMAGTTAPYSVAGTGLIANIESLLLVLLTQVYKPGHPVFYGVGPSVTDMKSGHDLYYRSEKMLFKLMGIEMARHYGLPVTGEAAGTLSASADVQNGAEGMLYLLASMAGGQNLICGLGSMYNANGMSAEQIVMQCGMIDMAEFVARGVDASDEKLAVDSIRNVGPGGNFLTDQLTIDLLRGDEFFHTPHLDLSGGYAAGAPNMFAKACQTVDRLLSEYKPAVPEKVQEAVRKFFRGKYKSKEAAQPGC